MAASFEEALPDRKLASRLPATTPTGPPRNNKRDDIDYIPLRDRSYFRDP